MSLIIDKNNQDDKLCIIYNIELCPYTLVHTKPLHARTADKTIFSFEFALYETMLFLARRRQTSWVANFDFPCYKTLLLFALTLKEE